jgi:hypothetical protein
MNHVIDYVSIDDGQIRLYSNDCLQGKSSDATELASIIRRHNTLFGAAWKIMASSLFIEATCGSDESAQEAGFMTGKEVADLWDEVCSYV